MQLSAISTNNGTHGLLRAAKAIDLPIAVLPDINSNRRHSCMAKSGCLEYIIAFIIKYAAVTGGTRLNFQNN